MKKIVSVPILLFLCIVLVKVVSVPIFAYENLGTRALVAMPKDSGYVLASGCEVPGVAPPEKIDWFMELIDELCKEN